MQATNEGKKDVESIFISWPNQYLINTIFCKWASSRPVFFRPIKPKSRENIGPEMDDDFTLSCSLLGRQTMAPPV